VVELPLAGAAAAAQTDHDLDLHDRGGAGGRVVARDAVVAGDLVPGEAAVVAAAPDASLLFADDRSAARIPVLSSA
jgi:hypothetical protein